MSPELCCRHTAGAFFVEIVALENERGERMCLSGFVVFQIYRVLSVGERESLPAAAAAITISLSAATATASPRPGRQV